MTCVCIRSSADRVMSRSGAQTVPTLVSSKNTGGGPKAATQKLNSSASFTSASHLQVAGLDSVTPASPALIPTVPNSPLLAPSRESSLPSTPRGPVDFVQGMIDGTLKFGANDVLPEYRGEVVKWMVENGKMDLNQACLLMAESSENRL